MYIFFDNMLLKHIIIFIMEEYNKQFDNIYEKAKNAINKGDSIVICGPENSGNTYIKNKCLLLFVSIYKYII